MEIEMQGITNWGVLMEVFWFFGAVGAWSWPQAPAPQGRAALCKHRLIRALWEEKSLGIRGGSDVCSQQISQSRLAKGGMRLGLSLKAFSWFSLCCAPAGERRPGHSYSRKGRNVPQKINTGSLNQWQQTPASNNLRNCKEFFLFLV